MITNDLSWLQQGHCVAKMTSKNMVTSLIQAEKKWHQPIKKKFPFLQIIQRVWVTERAIASPPQPKINTLLMVTEKCGKDRDNHREKKKNHDRDKELWALKVIKGWTPVGEAFKNCSDLCASFRSYSVSRSPWRPGLLCHLERKYLDSSNSVPKQMFLHRMG